MSPTRFISLASGLALSFSAALAGQNASLDLNRAYGAELQADAQARSSSLLDGGATYANGEHILTDGSGDNTLALGGTAQFRYRLGLRSDDPPIGADNGTTMGFDFGAVRAWAHGNVYASNMHYRIQTLFTNDGTFVLEDAYAVYDMDNGLSLKFGQFKLPFLREENIDLERQLAVDRSETNYFFTQGYSQGIQFMYAQDQWRLQGGFSDGTLSGNTAYNSEGEADYAFNARFDYMFAGTDWNRFEQFTSWMSAPTDLAGVAGAALIYESFGNTNPSGTEVTNFMYTLDCALQGQGWNAYGAVVGNTEDVDGADSMSNFGVVLQGGIFINNQVELFGRFDSIFLDLPDGSTQDDNLMFITAGANYYLSPESHAARFTADIVFSLNETGFDDGGGNLDTFLAGGTQTGILGDPSSGEVVLRLQASFIY